ncbi:hypothetical protein LTR08_003292 [Meristemomyces frigidus]|nr:hypothetical protein LTR08_003292 [Meristemomyces frigidus]
MAPTPADVASVSGPDSMAKPAAPDAVHTPLQGGSKPKKKKKTGNQRRKNRRQSFAAPSESNADTDAERPSLVATQRTSAQQASFYRLQSGGRSNTSLESEALLDHRQHDTGNRRQSVQQGFSRPSMPFARHRGSVSTGDRSGAGPKTSRLGRALENPISEDEGEMESTDRTPLLGSSKKSKPKPEVSRNNSAANHGNYGTPGRTRRLSKGSTTSSNKRAEHSTRNRQQATVAEGSDDEYDVNNPPSVPGSPRLGNLDDVMIAELTNASPDRGRDAVITIDDEYDQTARRFSSASGDAGRRRPTVADLAERDVCFPADVDLSEIGEEEDEQPSRQGSVPARRRRARQWPDLDILEDWAHEEREEATHQDHIRSKKISEPVMVGGRLRPGKTVWHREVDDAPFRYTYFNEVLDGTIHARTISDLLQDGATFRDLFIPDPVELDESSDSGDGENRDNSSQRQPPSTLNAPNAFNGRLGPNGGPHHSRTPSESASVRTEKQSPSASRSVTGSNTPVGRTNSGVPRPRQNKASKRSGTRPTFWLDILSPTEEEMKIIARAFGIHQLTTEDIMMEEEREKVELFQNYYFVNYRSFEQDKDSDDYMEPVNIYVVVFRDGVLTFHNSMTPHPANVRRRIRQLNDYMSPTADWISYAIIDDVTDVYAPLVTQIECEVDEIDDDILYMHDSSDDSDKEKDSDHKKGKTSSSEKDERNEKSSGDSGQKSKGDKTTGRTGGNMLMRVGECRKKVMGLYRLLGNKADVIKGFAKRCNEHWEVAPRSEIGLYLGDIQDHIVTMTGNLSHYENLLSRAHSNYLAQINIRMNERAELTADVLGKLTVLGTIVLPMNIITGMWGMNVWVPGQEYEGDLTWFWCITAGLIAFGLGCFSIAKKVYGIV